MSQLAIGMIETVGLAAAIEAADVCVKSANVNLIGYELSRGNGMAVNTSRMDEEQQSVPKRKTILRLLKYLPVAHQSLILNT